MHRCSQSDNAHQCRRDIVYSLKPCDVDEQQARRYGENVGDKKRGQGQLDGSQAGLHGVAAGDACTRIGCQCYGRRNIGHNAKVEDKEMRGDKGHA